MLGKGKRLPSPAAPAITRATQLLETLHVDIWGPARVASYGGSKYFLTCYDDYSHHIAVYFIRTKGGALKALKDQIALAENQTSHKVKKIRSDGGGEFMSRAARAYYGEKGIQHLLVPPASHAQNGRVERVHLTLLDSVRTFLTAAGLPTNLSAEAASHAAYTRNHVPAKPNNITPLEAWSGKPADYSKLQPFGAKVFFRRHEAISKLDPRYAEGVLLGYTHLFYLSDLLPGENLPYTIGHLLQDGGYKRRACSGEY